MGTYKWCKHYRGLRNFQNTEPSCFTFRVRVASASSQTVEEMAAEIKERFAKVDKAREAIVEHCGGPWERGMGESVGIIACPVCNGTEALQFWRSGDSGHIHAGCATEDCVAWMEWDSQRPIEPGT